MFKHPEGGVNVVVKGTDDIAAAKKSRIAMELGGAVIAADDPPRAVSHLTRLEKHLHAGSATSADPP